MSACLIFALAGLAVSMPQSVSQSSFVVAIDASQSMGATDLAPDRLTVAVQTAASFITSVPASTHIGIVSFAGSTHIERALTDDKDLLINALERMQLQETGGTDFEEAIVTSINMLADEEYGVIILLSDGQINVGGIDDAIAYADSHDTIIHTIALGTPEGGNASFGLSKVDEDSLKALAYNTGGVFFNATNNESAYLSFESIAQLKEGIVTIPLAPYLIFAALCLFIIQFVLTNVKHYSLP